MFVFFYPPKFSLKLLAKFCFGSSTGIDSHQRVALDSAAAEIVGFSHFCFALPSTPGWPRLATLHFGKCSQPSIKLTGTARPCHVGNLIPLHQRLPSTAPPIHVHQNPHFTNTHTPHTLSTLPPLVWHPMSHLTNIPAVKCHISHGCDCVSGDM